MSENKFLNFVIGDGIISTFIGLIILLGPKITPFSFGFTLCIIYLVYGLYKIIMGFINKNISKLYLNEILTGLIVTITGVLLFFAQSINIMLIITLIGIFLLLQSISSSVFMFRIKNNIQLWWLISIPAFLELFFSIIVIISLSPLALWFAGVLTGLDFLIRGIIYINLRISKY